MMRLCPLCGQRTEDARCPSDGTATLVLSQNPDSRLVEGAEVNGRYRIGKLIGQGGFGAVYRAISLATGSEVAIKVLGVSLDNDEPELIQRFYAEAQITAALKHPNTIRVFDFGQTDSGALYIAMELLIGEALNEQLRDRRRKGDALDQAETVRIGVQTLRSLAEAHTHGLVHRDLKPHNIFLNQVPGDDPVVKVLDFGIAKRLGSNLTGTGQAFGTPVYMSPEQAQNRGIDARSDLYSLGCVLYQCVTGSPPFEGDNPLAVLLSHVTDTPPSLRKHAVHPLSDDFIAVIEKALAKSPDARFSSAQEMRAALERVAPAPAEKPSSQPRDDASHPSESLRLDIDAAASADDRTAAYQPVANADDARPKRAVVAQAGVDIDGETAAPGSGFTEAFMLDGEVVAAAAAKVEHDEASAARPGRSLAPLFAFAGVLLVGGAVAGYMLFGPKAGAQADPVPVAAADVAGANPGDAAGVAAGDDAGAQTAEAAAPDAEAAPAADAAVAAAEDAAAPTEAAADVAVAPVATAVEVRTTPDAAEVWVDGKQIGVTPKAIEVQAGGKIRARLHKDGFRDLEIVVEPDMAPVRQVALTAEPKAKRPRPGGGDKPKTSRPSSTPSALEERL